MKRRAWRRLEYEISFGLRQCQAFRLTVTDKRNRLRIYVSERAEMLTVVIFGGHEVLRI